MLGSSPASRSRDPLSTGLLGADISNDPLSTGPLRDSARNGARTQDAFGAPADLNELPRDPLAGPARDGGSKSVRESGRGRVRDRSRGVPEDPPGMQMDSKGAIGVRRTRNGSLSKSAVATAPTVGDLAVAFDEEERELWRQVRRKSEFEMRVAEKRAQLAELRDKRRSVSSSCADAVASVDNLTGQLDFAKMHEKEIRHDIAVLHESNLILQTAFQAKKLQKEEAVADLKSGHLAHTLTEKERQAIRREAREKAQSIETKREQEAVLEYEQIMHLRAHLERLVAEKSSLQQRQQALLDKQHAAEQDRNLLLSSLQEERKGINDLRHERLRVWEERHAMEREMTNIVQEAHFRVLKEKTTQRYRGGVDPNIIAAEENSHIQDPFAQEASFGKSILSGGVRVPATLDTPAAFASNSMDPFSSKDSLSNQPKTRSEWTRFAGDAVQRGSGGVVDSAGAGFGVGFGVDSGAPNGGVTEWSGRLEDYRAGARAT